MDHNGQQQQEEEREQTECPACHARPMSERFVWLRRGNYYHKQRRCVECIASAQNAATDAAIRRDRDSYGGADNILVGGDIFTKTSSGYRTESQKPLKGLR